MTAPNKTDSRLAALCEVLAGEITYSSQTGVYQDKNGPVSGARRRTFAELRTAKAITGESPVELTAVGRDLVEDWS